MSFINGRLSSRITDLCSPLIDQMSNAILSSDRKFDQVKRLKVSTSTLTQNKIFKKESYDKIFMALNQTADRQRHRSKVLCCASVLKRVKKKSPKGSMWEKNRNPQRNDGKIPGRSCLNFEHHKESHPKGHVLILFGTESCLGDARNTFPLISNINGNNL